MFVLFLPHLSSSCERANLFFFFLNATCLFGTKCAYGWLTIAHSHSHNQSAQSFLQQCGEANKVTVLYE